MPEWLEVFASGTFALVVVTLFVAGYLRGFVGFGGAMVSVPALALAYGPVESIAISTVIGIPSALVLLPAAIRESEPPVVLPISAAVVLATPFGTWILVSVEPAIMKIAIGALVLAMSVFLMAGWKLSQQVPAPVLAAAGAAGGLVQGAAGVGGPPVVAVALSRAGSPRQQRGNVLGVMTAVTFASVLPLIYFELFSVRNILMGAVLAPVYAIGTWSGARFFDSGGSRYFRVAALAMLAAIGLVTMFVSVREHLSAGGA
ncbi:MAG: sulfite exporter TauE/SafE family protein [Pseudomonadota bacterium]